MTTMNLLLASYSTVLLHTPPPINYLPYRQYELVKVPLLAYFVFGAPFTLGLFFQLFPFDKLFYVFTEHL